MALKLKHILCATDGTEHSDAAVEFASDLASAVSAKLTLLAVQPYILTRTGPVTTLDAAHVKAALDRARLTAERMGVTEIASARSDARDVADAIIVIADEQHADHIVVGSAGKNLIKRAVLGSVSSDVVHRAHCPVTVVH